MALVLGGVTALLVVGSLALKASARLFLALIVGLGGLLIVGLLYPYVARALGVPYSTVYELVSALWNTNVTITY